MKKNKSFEQSLPVIIEQIEKRRKRWTVRIPYVDFDDIKQLLLIHIFKKWNQFDPDKGELSHWVSKICSAQIKNHWRNFLGNTVPPCDYCPANEGGDKCRIFGTQDPTQCGILAKWAKTKTEKYNLRLAANIDEHEHTLYKDGNEINYEQALTTITNLIRKELTKRQFLIYQMLYLENKTESEVGKELGYKSSHGRSAGYASILAYKKIIIQKIKNIIREHDIV